MAEKRLAIVVDGTTAMAPHWPVIYSIYLEKIIRNFCHNGSTSQDPSSGNYMLNLVVYGASDPSCRVQQSGWTKDMDIFLQWLSTLSFNGGGLSEAAIAEGLSNTLMMFQSNLSGTQVQQLGQRHCILAAASDPSRLPRPAITPRNQISDSGEISEVRTGCHVADVEAIASSFAQSFVSLSLICPRHFPRLRAIYDAGNLIHQDAASFAYESNHSQYLVLLSKSFMEAHDAIKQLEEEIIENAQDLLLAFPENCSAKYIQLPQQIPNEWRTRQQEISYATASVQSPKANAYIDDGNGLAMLSRRLSNQNISVGNIPTEAEKVGFDALKPNESRPFGTNSSYIPQSSYNRLSSIQASLNKLNSQKHVGFGNSEVEPTPRGTVLSQSTYSGCFEQVNARFRTSLAPQFPYQLSKSKSINTVHHNTSLPFQVNSKELRTTPNSNLSTDLKISQPPAAERMGLPRGVNSESLMHNILNGGKATVGLCSAGSKEYENLGKRNSQLLADLLRLGNARRHFYRPTMENNECGSKRKHSNAFGLLNIANELSMKSMDVDNIPRTHMSFPEGSAIKYIKAWEGCLTLEEQGQTMLVSRLVAYRKKLDSEKIFADWPLMLHIDHLISQNYLNNNPYPGDIKYLVFKAIESCPKLNEMKDKRLCAYIKLPQQTLVLSVPTNDMRLIGSLYQGVFPVYKHQIYSPQQNP